MSGVFASRVSCEHSDGEPMDPVSVNVLADVGRLAVRSIAHS